MTVKVRAYKRGGFEVDIRFTCPDGKSYRDRRRSPVSGKSASLRWGQAREMELLRAGPSILEQAPPKKEVETLEKFARRFIKGYARAERQKASTIATKERVLGLHLLPRLGTKTLDAITNEDIQQLKGALAHLNAKTTNNIINVLSKLLNVAVEWGVIPVRPCTIKLLKTRDLPMPFYEDETYARLVEGAKKVDPRVLVMVLLGGDAGLRRSEMVSLRQTDVDFRRRQLHVRLATWQGIEDTPKGGRTRIIPLTAALTTAMSGNRHLRGDRVLHQDDGRAVDDNVLQHWMEDATRRAGLPVHRSLHILRHTFCSRLSMKGAPAKAIQELAGHQSLTTTLRYMHLSPSARERRHPAARRDARNGASGRNFWRHLGDGDWLHSEPAKNKLISVPAQGFEEKRAHFQNMKRDAALTHKCPTSLRNVRPSPVPSVPSCSAQFPRVTAP